MFLFVLLYRYEINILLLLFIIIKQAIESFDN